MKLNDLSIYNIYKIYNNIYTYYIYNTYITTYINIYINYSCNRTITHFWNFWHPLVPKIRVIDANRAIGFQTGLGKLLAETQTNHFPYPSRSIHRVARDNKYDLHGVHVLYLPSKGSRRYDQSKKRRLHGRLVCH